MQILQQGQTIAKLRHCRYTGRMMNFPISLVINMSVCGRGVYSRACSLPV